MSTPRKPFPQLNAFRDFINQELSNRKSDFPTPTIAPFAKMTSVAVDPDIGYAFFSLGLHGFDSTSPGLFDLTYGSGRDVIGYAYDINNRDASGKMKRRLIYTDDISPAIQSQFTTQQAAVTGVQNQLALEPHAKHPIPGITSVNVIRSGLGQPMIAKVTWQCYDRGQLEFLRNHFLIPGNFILVEFGNQFSDKQVASVLDMSNADAAIQTLLTCVGAVGDPNNPALEQIGRSFIIENFNKPNGGNYDFIVGQVGNFEIFFEPESNIYKCVTHVVSQGENIWGLSINQTFVAQTDADLNKITTIGEYFTCKEFDAFIESTVNQVPGIVRNNNADALKLGKEAKDQSEYSNVSFNASDYAFLSWDFFFNDFLNDLMNVIQDKEIVAEIKQFTRFSQIQPNEWVGFHPDLLSVMPENMILITAKNQANTKTFAGPYFGTTTDAFNRGAKINEGVWINSECIRQCFVGAINLRQALNSLLLRLSEAVAGYWQLQLFMDEEAATYRIIDYKYGDLARDLQFYKFNIGGAGECLEIEFNSAFPPELITQMMLVSKLRSSTPQEQQFLLDKYPLLNSSSKHMFVLNWTNLQDELQLAINAWRSGKTIPAITSNIKSKNLGNSQIDSQGKPTQRRISPDGAGAGFGSTVTGVGQSDDPGQKVGQPGLTTNSSVVNDLFTPAPIRNSVTTGTTPNPTIKVIIPRNPPGSSMNGSLAWKNNNPGNLQYAGQGGAVPGAGGFAQFNTPEDGYLALIQQLAIYRDRNLNLSDTIYAYAPPSQNNTSLYLSQASNALGVQPNTSLQNIDLNDLAKFISKKESGSTVIGSVLIPPPGTADITRVNRLSAAAYQSQAAPIDPFNPASQLPTTPQQAKQEAIFLRRKEVTFKFGEMIYTLIAPHMGDMIATITRDGYANLNKPNSFVTPYPTTTSVSVEIQGIAGISISDGFYLDKIPFTFEKYGIFQVVETEDQITVSKGWRTIVKGYFKLLWYDGNPPAALNETH